MALVAYGSSDSESDIEDIEDPPGPQINKFLSPPSTSTRNSTITSFDQLDLIEDLDNDHPTKFNLPAPITKQTDTWAEDDDEFLAKKVTYRGPIEKPPPPPLAKKPKSTTVKIVLPALSSFSSFKQKESTVTTGPQPAKATSLLDMLPKPKQNFPAATKKKVLQGTSSLVPDSITRKAKTPIATTSKGKPGTSNTSNSSKVHSDSDGSDDDDFFSLNREDDGLPEISIAEINAMVATKSARINQTLKQHEAKVAAAAAQAQEDQEAAESAAAAALVNEQAITALCGSRAKRARKDEINIIDVSGDHLINRDEWIRNQLTATTEYQPRGLVDEEPGAGTKRKHQITYLAHQAKANEQELQAMWATNRHTRRQTQNKYGF